MVLKPKSAIHWLQVVVHAGALVPLAWIGWAYWHGLFVIDPVAEITNLSGRTALILLFLSLACTPVITVLGYKPVGRVRRALGIYAFVYAAVHFLTFVGLDYGFDLGLIGQAIFDQRFVIVGFAAGLILLALTITATKGWQRRLGRNWKRLHRLAYLAGVLAALHFLWSVKDIREPLRYVAVLALFLVLRIPWLRRAISRGRRRLTVEVRRLRKESDALA
jgi:sulfoxide reductase heme-binding subunit YedZ